MGFRFRVGRPMVRLSLVIASPEFAGYSGLYRDCMGSINGLSRDIGLYRENGEGNRHCHMIFTAESLLCCIGVPICLGNYLIQGRGWQSSKH